MKLMTSIYRTSPDLQSHEWANLPGRIVPPTFANAPTASAMESDRACEKKKTRQHQSGRVTFDFIGLPEPIYHLSIIVRRPRGQALSSTASTKASRCQYGAA